MQSITYTNAAGKILEISPASECFIFQDISGTTSADVDIATSAPAGMDGILIHNAKLTDREITVNLHIRGTSLEDMFKRRQELIALTSPVLNRSGKLGELIYRNAGGAWRIPAAIKIGAKDTGRRRGFYQPMRIVFSCPNPYWRDIDVSISRLAYLSGGFAFPLRIPAVTESQPGIRFGSRGYKADIFSAGDAPAPLEIAVTGPALLPTIEHQQTGKRLIVNRELGTGDTLRIITAAGNKTVEITLSTGEKEDAMGALDSASDFFSLQPGNNTLIQAATTQRHP